MTAWEDLKAQGVSAAQASLSGREDEVQLVDWLREWLAETNDVYRGNRSKIAEHRATALLADKFAAAGLAELADHLRRFAEETGPIHPGIWLFALLLGKACANALIEGLHQQQWREAALWGHDSFGAWEAYRNEIARLLMADEASRQSAWAFADQMIAKTIANPAQHVALAGDRTSVIIKEMTDFAGRPLLKEAWETSLNSYVYFSCAFFLKLLAELDCTRCLLALARLPHPVFVGQSLGIDEPDAIPAALVAASPLAFDDRGVFLHEGMVIVVSLRAAEIQIRRRGWGGGNAPIIYSAEDTAALEAAAQSADTAIAPIIDALFARADAEPVAWAWLEHLIFEIEHRGHWRIDRRQGNGVALDIARILISRIASHLAVRGDWQIWVLENKPLWQIDRFMAILAVCLWGKNASADSVDDYLDWALMECVIEFAGADSAVVRPDGIVGYLGAACILAKDQPELFLHTLWHRTRPVRERAWRTYDTTSVNRNQIGALVAFWGTRAFELGDGAARTQLEPVIEHLLRDTFQTEPEARLSGFWPKALQRFTKALSLPLESDNDGRMHRLANFIRPFARPDPLFLDLIVNLETGTDREVIQSALASIGVDLTTIVREFFDTESMRIHQNAYQKQWLERVRSLGTPAL